MSYDYRQTLRDEFISRCGRNPLLSQRSFARQLKIAPSRLNEILNGKRGTTVATGERLAQNLGLNGDEKDLFLLSIVMQHGRSLTIRDRAKKKLEQKIHQQESTIDLDSFKIIRDWHHNVILELIDAGIATTTQEIQKNIGVSSHVAIDALKRLEKLKMISQHKGVFKTTSRHTTTTNDIPSSDIKEHHCQMLDRARTALFEQSPSTREFGSVTLAFDPMDFKEIQQVIRECRKRVAQIADRGKNRQIVATLGTQFFNQTMNSENAESENFKSE